MAERSLETNGLHYPRLAMFESVSDLSRLRPGDHLCYRLSSGYSLWPKRDALVAEVHPQKEEVVLFEYSRENGVEKKSLAFSEIKDAVVEHWYDSYCQLPAKAVERAEQLLRGEVKHSFCDFVRWAKTGRDMTLAEIVEVFQKQNERLEKRMELLKELEDAGGDTPLYRAVRSAVYNGTSSHTSEPSRKRPRRQETRDLDNEMEDGEAGTLTWKQFGKLKEAIINGFHRMKSVAKRGAKRIATLVEQTITTELAALEELLMLGRAKSPAKSQVKPKDLSAVIRKHYSRLLDALSNVGGLSTVVGEAYSQGLVSREVKDDVLDPSERMSVRVNKLLNAIQCRVEKDASAFSKFVGILETEAALRPWAEDLRREMCA